MINTIILGHTLNVLPQLPAESVSCVTCSPPYWSLRDYGVDPVIWDGDKDCKHEWGLPIAGAGKNDDKTAGKMQRGNKGSIGRDDRPDSNFCLKCGAWRGSLGLEPTFELYIKHLCDIFDEVKRVLRKDGTCWVNLGDSYSTTMGTTSYTGINEHGSNTLKERLRNKNYGLPNKSLCDIPYRFSIEMTNRGWIKRNTIIWHKPNCMPSSAPDRFTVDFEYLFYFTKNNKAIFWTNEKTLECVGKKPLGIKGIEGVDWEWRVCPNCKGTGKVKVNIEDRPEIYGENDPAGMRRGRMRDFLDKKKDMYQAGDKPCKRCKELGKIKYSFWSGHDYWFEQQFDKYTGPLDRWGGDNLKATNKSDWDEGTGQTTYRDRNMRPNDQGRNKRCVWIIPTQPFPEAHFAVYPEGLIEIPIKAGCPEFICKKCGKARVKILEPTEEYKKLLNQSWTEDTDKDKKLRIKIGFQANTKKVSCTADYKFIGYTDCGCNAGWEGGITLDPFMGAGTSALVALKQRKRFIGIEIKQSYIDMSYKRIARVQQRIF